MNISFMIPFMLLLTLLSGCSNNEQKVVIQSAPPPLATTGEMALEQDEFCRRLTANPLTPPLEIIRRWSQEAVLLEEAYKRKLHLRPDVIQRSRRVVEQVLMAELERELAYGIEPPGGRTVKRWWDRHFHSFRVKRPMRRAHLFSHSNPDSASRIRDLLLGDVSQEWIQKQMPEVRIHDSGFLFREEFRLELAACLFDSTSDISEVLPIGALYFVVKREGTRDPDHHFTVTEVEEEISARLLHQERSRLLSSWRSEQYRKIDLTIDTVRMVAVAESLLLK